MIVTFVHGVRYPGAPKVASPRSLANIATNI